MFRLALAKSIQYPIQLGSRYRSALARATWAVLLLLHAWVLCRAIPAGTASFSSLLLLVVSNAFFLLKLLDLELFRFKWDRRSLVAAGMVVLLLHVGAIDPHLGREYDPTPWVMAKMSSLSLLVGWFARFIALAGMAVALAVLAASRAHTLIAYYDSIAADVQRRLCHSLVNTLIASRPPPSV